MIEKIDISDNNKQSIDGWIIQLVSKVNELVDAVNEQDEELDLLATKASR